MAESAAARAIRLLDLVPFLNAHPGVRLHEVAEEFAITKQELMKDLNLLFLCGLPGYTPLELIDLSFDDGIVVVKDPQNLDAPRAFSEQEALIVRIALAGLADSLPTEYRGKIEDLRRKFAEIFKSEIPDSAIFYRGAKERDYLKLIERAITENLKIEITYLNPARDTLTNRRISPMTVELGRNRTLIDAWCDLADGPRRFNLANIETISLTDQPRQLSGETGRPDAYLAKISGASSSWFIRENESSLRKSQSDDYEIEIFQEEWLIRSVLASAGEIAVLEPLSVADRIRQLSESALKNYLAG